MKKQLRGVSYIRVSTPSQVDKTSPKTQRVLTKEYIEKEGWKFLKSYEDLGISGSDTVSRESLQKLLADAFDKKFERVVVHKIDRFGRDTEDFLHNKRLLAEAGVDLISISEPSDSTYVGDFQTGMHAQIAQLERDRITERGLQGKLRKLKEGKVPLGRLPYGRYFEYTKETPYRRIYEGGPCGNGIYAEQEAVEKMQYMYEQAIKGKSFMTIAKEIGIRYGRLLRIIREQLGSKLKVIYKPNKKFKWLENGETFTVKVPALLSDEKIAKLVGIIEKNRLFDKRPDIKMYPLSGYLKCGKCGRSFTGQLQHRGTKHEKGYYRHPYQTSDCREITYLKADEIENKVFELLFNNFYDKPAFLKAIQKDLPNAAYIDKLQILVKTRERDLKRVEQDLEKLIDAVLEGTLSKEVVKNREAELIKKRERLETELADAKEQLDSLPKLDEIQVKAEAIRKQLLAYFGSEDRLKKMSYEDKRLMLNDLFANSGIYVSRNGEGVKIDISAALNVRGWRHYRRWKDSDKTNPNIGYNKNSRRIGG